VANWGYGGKENVPKCNLGTRDEERDLGTSSVEERFEA
jgi:hypothetical protein